MAQADIPVQPGETVVTAALRRLAGAQGWCVTHTVDGQHAPGSLHYVGRAVDLAGRSGPGVDTLEMSVIAARVLEVVPLPLISELIWAGPGPRYVKNGQLVDGLAVYGAATLAEHHNHVHLGVAPNFTYSPARAADAQKVTPMYSPPLGPIAAAWLDDQGRVISAVDPAGHVFWGKWYGNTAGKPYWGNRTAALIGARPDGQPGYRITATDGAFYDLPDGLDRL